MKIVVLGGTVVEPAVTLLSALSAAPGYAIVVWCPPLSIEVARESLRVPVVVVEHDVPLVADQVYVVPADRGMSIERERFADRGREHGGFDQLLRTAADAFAVNAIGVVLAGSGEAGSLGIKRLKEAGGLTIAQQVVAGDTGMPFAAIETGFVDLTLPIQQIAAHIIETPADITWPPSDVEATNDTLRDILTLVRVRTGHDFSSYKRATLFRRIGRRMQVCDCATLDGYHQYLREHPQELPKLLRDFLISVTNFFRDQDAFVTLEAEIIPRLFLDKGSLDQIRVWVAGCATGEEAYSIAILLAEHASTMSAPPSIQVFATDIDEAALTEARRGCYSEAIVNDVSRERLLRFFTRESGEYRVTKELREMLLFSPHNVLRDPPFSRLDMVSCRNLLIYLNRDAQLSALSFFHFGLKPSGILFLGSSESAEYASTFAPIDLKNRIFVRQSAAISVGEAVVSQRWATPSLPPGPISRERSSPIGELHHRLVEYYAPPSILLNADLEIVHMSEHAGTYLQFAGGEPTRQALRLVHPDLRLDLRTAIYAAQQGGSERRVVQFGSQRIELRARTVELTELGRGGVLVMFDELPGEGEPISAPASTTMEPVVRQIEDELARTRDQLRTTV